MPDRAQNVTDIAADLAYVRDVAEQGRSAPLLSGPYFLIWGGLAVVALLVHWAALQGMIAALTQDRIGFIWMVYGITGTVFSALAGRATGRKPGARSIANRVSANVWMANSAMIFTYAIAMTASVAVAGAAGTPLDHTTLALRFDTILPLSFGGYAVAFYVTGQMGDVRWMSWASRASLLATAMCVFLLGQPALYLFAAVFVTLVVVIPGALLLRQEPAALTDGGPNADVSGDRG